MSDCVFINNYARETGGACRNVSGPMTLTNCLIVGNHAGEFGGAFRTIQGTLELTNCTVVGNRAPNGSFLALGQSGGIWPSQVEVSNCIVDGDDCLIWNNDSTVEINYTNMQQNNLVCHDPSLGISWGVGNTEVDPLFVDPGHWDANSTPNDANDDFFVEGDYHLKSQGGHWDSTTQSWIIDDVTSPCIDAGDPNSPIGLEPFPNGGRVNMGAYGGTQEASKSYFGEPICETIIAGDINGDCRVDFDDLKILIDHVSIFFSN